MSDPTVNPQNISSIASAKLLDQRGLPDGVAKVIEIADTYKDIIHYTRYARWNGVKRENWNETVERYIECMSRKCGGRVDLDEVREAIRAKKVMPSMRALATAGPALEKHNIACYNCAFTSIQRPEDFSEIMYILMHGTGVGFSVENRYVSKLPVVGELKYLPSVSVIFGDSKDGWYKGLVSLMWCLFKGIIPSIDVTRVRARGAPLKTFGGKASGPGPIRSLYVRLVAIFRAASGRQLTALECMDIVCWVARSVVVGGRRRSALLALTDLDDEECALAKSGKWWEDNPQRASANISAVYSNGITRKQFMKEWANIQGSGSGERGIFNRDAVRERAVRIGREDRDDYSPNPCCEIILPDKGFCNLTEVVLRPDDTEETIMLKVKLAARIGTIQSTFTDFKLLSPEWKNNCEREHLLGVSLTGMMDCPLTNINRMKTDPKGLEWLFSRMRDVAREENCITAAKLGIPPSAAVTCVKPSGTVSQLVDSSSGVHPRHSRKYIRAIRNATSDPITTMLKERGFYCERDSFERENTTVFYFPIECSPDAVVREDLAAIDFLKYIHLIQDNWCDHKVSATVNLKDSDWEPVGEWVFENMKDMSGTTFFPYSDHVYPQAPYRAVTDKEFEKEKAQLLDGVREIDWDKLLPLYEDTDVTETGQEFACSAGVCEI